VASTLGQDCEHDRVPATAPASRFADHGDGSVTDTASGLVWKRCSEGQTGDAATGAGAATTHDWREAMALAETASDAGKEDWRLGRLEELATLVEKACARPDIDPQTFLETAPAVYRSATPDETNANDAWFVHFRDGHGAKGHRYRADHVRLVQGGQRRAVAVLTPSCRVCDQVCDSPLC